MTEKFIVVDSDILIDVSRGVPQAIQELENREQANKLCLSVITQLELMVGCENKKEFKELEAFLERFNVLHLTTAMSTKAVEFFEAYRLSHGLKIADMLIASTALAYVLDYYLRTRKISDLLTT